LIDAGRAISTRPVLKKACNPIRGNLDFDSNITEENDLHFERHLSPKASTDVARMASAERVLRNASLFICENFGVDSNVTDQSDPQ
jgi:hypothetical protein